MSLEGLLRLIFFKCWFYFGGKNVFFKKPKTLLLLKIRKKKNSDLGVRPLQGHSLSLKKLRQVVKQLRERDLTEQSGGHANNF